MYGLKTECCFDSAHFLADYHGKCENLHGHRWRVVAYLGASSLGGEGTERDMVCDFSAFKSAVRGLCAEFDHTFLVEEGTLASATVAALESEGFSLKVVPYRTTAENLARVMCEELRARGLPCVRTDVYETPLNCATYVPDEG